MHNEREMGKKCLHAVHSDLFCLRGAKATPPSPPVQDRPPAAVAAYTRSCNHTSRTTGGWDGERLGRWEQRWEAIQYGCLCFHSIVFDGFCRPKCSFASMGKTSSIYIHVQSPPQEDHFSVNLSNSLSPLYRPLGSPPSGFAEAPTPETHTGFNAPVSRQSCAL